MPIWATRTCFDVRNLQIKYTEKKKKYIYLFILLQGLQNFFKQCQHFVDKYFQTVEMEIIDQA